MAKKTITLDKVGPISHLEIPLPDEGGIVCLRATHGAGKSKALSAVQSLIVGEGKIPIQDNQDVAEMNGLGIKIVIKRSSLGRPKRYGQLEVESLEGKFDLGDLLDPGIDDEARADAKRIKSLIAISGIKADQKLFHPLFSSHDEFKQVVQVVSTESKDLIEMAARVKKDIESAARQNELLFEEKSAQAHGLNSSVPHEIVEMDLPDLASLEADLKTAQNECATIRVTRKMAEQAHERHKMQMEQLGQITAGDLEEIVNRGKFAADDVAKLEMDIAALEKSLVTTKAFLVSAVTRRDGARAEYKKASEDQKKIQELQASLAEELPAIPTDEEITSADLNVQVVLKHIEMVKSKEKLQEVAGNVRQLIAESEEAKLMGQRYRKAALEVDKVLSDAISKAGSPLRVDNGRLVLNTDRGIEKFSDLSDGEKAKVGIDFQLGSMGGNGLMVLKQSVFEGLNEPIRKEIAEHAKLRKVTILTAACSEDQQIEVEVL